MSIVNIIKELPDELQDKMLQYYEAIKEELIHTATKEDVDSLRMAIKELHQAQMNTEKSISELIEVQKRNQWEIAGLTREMKNVKTQLGGLSHSVGFDLENQAYKHLPKLIIPDCGHRPHHQARETVMREMTRFIRTILA